MNRKEIENLAKTNASKALEEVNKLLKEKTTKELLMLRAEIFQLLNRNTDAINDYHDILKKYGRDEVIKNRKEMLETIVGMTQLDIYACTNLHKDPWE